MATWLVQHNVQVSQSFETQTEAALPARAHFAASPPYRTVELPRSAAYTCPASQPARESAFVFESNRKSKNKADVSARLCLVGKYIWFASSVSVAISICKVTNVQVSHTEATVSARAHFAVTPPYHAATSPRKDASCCCSTSQPARGSAIVCELNIEEYSGYERESTLDGKPRVPLHS